MLMSLDQFVFGLSTLAYQELQRQTSWKHRSASRVNARDSRQFTGQGDDTVTLTGTLAPELTGSIASLDELRAMGDTGEAFAMVDGAGYTYGAYVIESVNETQTLFFEDGTPRKIDFTISLTRVDDDRVATFNKARR